MINTPSHKTFPSTAPMGKPGCRAAVCGSQSATDFPAAHPRTRAAEWHASRGLAQLNRREITSAISSFNQALMLDQSHFESLIGRARAFVAVNAFNMALRDLSKAFAVDADNADALALRTDIQARMRRLSGSDRDVPLALALEVVSGEMRADAEGLSARGVRAELYRSLDGDPIVRYGRNTAIRTVAVGWRPALKGGAS